MDNAVDHSEENNELKQLLALGRARGYLTYGEINDHLPQDIVEAEQLESIVGMITEMGIRVSDAPPDMEELLMSGEAVTADEAVEEAAAAMTAVEREGRARRQEGQDEAAAHALARSRCASMRCLKDRHQVTPHHARRAQNRTLGERRKVRGAPWSVSTGGRGSGGTGKVFQPRVLE